MMAAPEVQHAAARTVFERYAARDAMQTDIPIIGPSTPVGEVQQVLASRSLRGMPVIDQHGHMVGWAQLTLVMSESMQNGATSPVRNVMTRYPWVTPDDRLWPIVRRMQDFQINPVPVVSPSGHYHGLITIEQLTQVFQKEGPALLGRKRQAR
jgi:CBS domain-containing protein